MNYFLAHINQDTMRRQIKDKDSTVHTTDCHAKINKRGKQSCNLDWGDHQACSLFLIDRCQYFQNEKLS